MPAQAKENKYTPTRVGMLLLDPSGPYLWTVKSKKVLIRVSGGIDAQATLSKPFVPPDWFILDGESLARRLLGGGGAFAPLLRELLSEPKGV